MNPVPTGTRIQQSIGNTVAPEKFDVDAQMVAKTYKNKAGHTGAEINSRICFMLSIGIAPQVVMKFTGHADYKSMKPYIDIAEKAKTDAMDAMEKALGE